MTQKLIFTIILQFLTSSMIVCKAQEMPKNEETDKYEYEQVTKSKGSQQELYEKAKEWTSKYFQNENSKYNRNFKIIKTVNYSYSDVNMMGIKLPVSVKYDFSVSTVDGKYRLVVNNFMYGAEDIGFMSLEEYAQSIREIDVKSIEKRLDKEINAVINSLKYYMKNGEMKVGNSGL